MPPQEDKERLHQVARSERSPKNEEYPGGRQVLAVMYFHWHGTATATHHDPTPCQERATTCWPATQTHTHPHHTTHLDHTVGAHQASRQLKVRCVRGGDVAAAGHGGQKPPACKCKCHAFCNISHGHPQDGCPLKPRPCLPPPPPHAHTNKHAAHYAHATTTVAVASLGAGGGSTHLGTQDLSASSSRPPLSQAPPPVSTGSGRIASGARPHRGTTTSQCAPCGVR